jgi:7,8-dihydroneopterin aldolase/epimerase/oxygenase
MEAHGSHDSSVEVELRGLSIYTHHGVTDAEQEVGQRLEFDLAFDVVALAATERSYRTLERLCQLVAERLMERFDCESIRVRAAKPEPPVHYRVDEAGVEVTLERASEREHDDEGEGV